MKGNAFLLLLLICTKEFLSIGDHKMDCYSRYLLILPCCIGGGAISEIRLMFLAYIYGQAGQFVHRYDYYD